MSLSYHRVWCEYIFTTVFRALQPLVDNKQDFEHTLVINLKKILIRFRNRTTSVTRDSYNFAVRLSSPNRKKKYHRQTRREKHYSRRVRASGLCIPLRYSETDKLINERRAFRNFKCIPFHTSNTKGTSLKFR